MASTKRKSTGDGNGDTTRRVTRSATQQLQNPSVPTPPTETKPKTKETKTKKPKTTKADTTTTTTTTVAVPSVPPSASDSPTIVIEHCKQCSRFKTKAGLVQKGLEEAVPGITVLINPEKPRRGCFEIRQEGGQTFISLLDLKRPFKPMTDLNMEEVIDGIIKKIKA